MTDTASIQQIKSIYNAWENHLKDCHIPLSIGNNTKEQPCNEKELNKFSRYVEDLKIWVVANIIHKEFDKDRHDKNR